MVIRYFIVAVFEMKNVGSFFSGEFQVSHGLFPPDFLHTFSLRDHQQYAALRHLTWVAFVTSQVIRFIVN
jgi:hypothetical protein